MSSYREERIATRRAIMQQSRRRSREMELRVARYLSGHRVPMSGAGSMKGDCEVITDKVGKIFIECKYSARMIVGGKVIRIDYRWFDKMTKDAISMKAKFPALIFRYHGSRLSDYVIMSITPYTIYGDVEDLEGAITIDTGEANGITLFYNKLAIAMEAHAHKKNLTLLSCSRGMFIIMPISDFRDLINNPKKEGLDGYNYAES